MIVDKVLIFCDYAVKENEGGPVGYFNKCLYNNMPANAILLKTLLDELRYVTLSKKIKFRIQYLRQFFKKQKIFTAGLAIKFIKAGAFNYKFLYFHHIHDLSDVSHLINSKQIVILQSHSPELPSIEMKNYHPTDYKEVEILEKIAFERANYIVFPNIDCVSIYKELITTRNKIKYLTTGIKELINVNKFPLDNSKINILFIGRRIDIKGFNFLIQNFTEVVKSRDDLRLFVAGFGQKITGHNIYDIGSTETPFDWINSVDFVVSLNKTSYFDLNVIETICLGTPLIMTTTEGHEFFNNKKGIISVSYDNFQSILLNRKVVYKGFKEEYSSNLKELYKTHLSKEAFRNNLENLCKSIIDENNYV